MSDEKSGERQIQRVANPMSGELAESGGAGRQLQPVGGLISVEAQRTIAEVQARMIIARTNPRNRVRSMDAILNACQRPGLAEVAEYSYSRGGSEISGPSIKLAEEIACHWGNIASGIEELSRGEGYSECRAYAWDLETGYYDERKFQVRHWRDTKKGGYALEDERDIYELIANMGQRRKRAVLLTVLPNDVVAAARQQCDATLKAKADVGPDAVQKMAAAFKEFGITPAQIEVRIQRRLDTIQPAQMIALKRVYVSLRDGMSVPGDWFEATPVEQGGAKPAQGTQGLKDAVSGSQAKPEASGSGPALQDGQQHGANANTEQPQEGKTDAEPEKKPGARKGKAPPASGGFGGLE